MMNKRPLALARHALSLFRLHRNHRLFLHERMTSTAYSFCNENADPI